MNVIVGGDSKLFIIPTGPQPNLLPNQLDHITYSFKITRVFHASLTTSPTILGEEIVGTPIGQKS